VRAHLEVERMDRKATIDATGDIIGEDLAGNHNYLEAAERRMAGQKKETKGASANATAAVKSDSAKGKRSRPSSISTAELSEDELLVQDRGVTISYKLHKILLHEETYRL